METFWKSHYQRDPKILGRTMSIGGQPYKSIAVFATYYSRLVPVRRSTGGAARRAGQYAAPAKGRSIARGRARRAGTQECGAQLPGSA